MKNENPCGRGSGCCVAGETQILTPHRGMIRIERIWNLFGSGLAEEVSLVASIVGGHMASVKLVRVHRDAPKELLFIGMSEGITIKLTPYHPILVAGVFVRADAIREGMIVSGHVVRCARKCETLEPVYDLELDGEAACYVANGLTLHSFVRETVQA